MSYSLDLGPEAGINSTLAALRILDRPAAPIASNDILSPGVFLNFDPDTKIKATAESSPGSLLSLNFSVKGPASWIALHMELGDIEMSNQLMLGFACRSVAPESTTFRACLRSGTPDGFSDTFFRKTIVAYAEPSLHLDALTVEDYPDLNIVAPWRELVFFFRPESTTLTLQDLRVFVI